MFFTLKGHHLFTAEMQDFFQRSQKKWLTCYLLLHLFALQQDSLPRDAKNSQHWLLCKDITRFIKNYVTNNEG